MNLPPGFSLPPGFPTGLPEAEPPSAPPGPPPPAWRVWLDQAIAWLAARRADFDRLILPVLRWIGPQRSEWLALKAMDARQLAKAGLRMLVPGGNLLGPAEEAPHHALQHGGRLYALANSYPLPTWRPLARASILFTMVFLVWAMQAELDEVSIAEGEVVPEGKVKVVQHLEGGIIREIYVADGDEVKADAPLAQLDLALTSVNREELQVRLDGLILQRARLQSEIEGKPLVFPKEEAERQPVLVQSETQSFFARQQALKAALSVLQEQARGKGLEVAELEARHRSAATSLKLTQERFEMSKDLLKSGLTSRMEHVQLEGQLEELQGQLNTLRASIPRAQAAMSEGRQRVEEEQTRYNRTAQTELSEAEINIARTRELLSQASDQQRRALIASPIDGIVKNLRYNTIGGVVKPGEPILEIVPLHEQLQIEAKLSPMDRGYVQTGQKATVKLSAYDYTTYGGLEGKVILVAPDTTMNPENQPFYRVLVQTDRAYIGDDSSKRAITPGMQATVEIHTGTRTVMHYLIKPVIKLRHEAFRER